MVCGLMKTQTPEPIVMVSAVTSSRNSDETVLNAYDRPLFTVLKYVPTVTLVATPEALGRVRVAFLLPF